MEGSIAVSGQPSSLQLFKQGLGLIKQGKNAAGETVETEVYRESIDINNNGRVDPEEVLDSNHDKKVSDAELLAFFSRNISFIRNNRADLFKLGSAALRDFQLAGINKRQARYATLKLKVDASTLTPEQKQVRSLLVKAALVIDEIFWKQFSADGPELRQALEGKADPLARAMLRFLNLNYGRFDLLDGGAAFIGTGQRPPEGIFYPQGMTKQEFEAYLARHPEQKDELTRPNTFVRRDKKTGLLYTIAFEKEYETELNQAANYLEQAAAVTKDPALKKYLLSKAADLRSGNYYQGDVNWLNVADSRLDIIIGYQEVYDDGILNSKASYEAYVLQKDPEASKIYDNYKKNLPAYQAALPVRAELKDKKVTPRPIGVFDCVFVAGDGNQAVKAIATNLPNTVEVRNKYGNRIVMFRNVLMAKGRLILLPIARKIMDPGQVGLVNENDFADFIIKHEMSHSLGQDMAKNPETLAETVKIRGALKELYSSIEECKADTLATYNVRHDNLPEEAEMRFYATSLASIFRSIRFGAHEAHGMANLIRLNFLLKEGAIQYNPATGQWNITSVAAMRAGITKLSTELLEIEGYGDYNRAARLINEFGHITPEIEATNARLTDIPVDLEFDQTAAKEPVK